MSKPEIRAQQNYLRKENRNWPSRLAAVPEDRWDWKSPKPKEVWRSSGFLVQIFGADNGATRMTVCRTMVGKDGRWIDGVTWEDLMRLKDECGYGQAWAVEIFPPNLQVVDVANMRHLWILPDAPKFVWRQSFSCVAESETK